MGHICMYARSECTWYVCVCLDEENYDNCCRLRSLPASIILMEDEREKETHAEGEDDDDREELRDAFRRSKDERRDEGKIRSHG